MAWNANTVDSKILAVHAALVPGPGLGEVVLFGGDEHWWEQAEPNGDFRRTRVYDIAGHQVLDPDPAIPSPNSDVFCAHHVFTTDGRLLIAGGTQKWPESDIHAHDLDFLGHRRCWLYNHRRHTWTEVAKLNPNPAQPDAEHSGGRWYPGLVTLGNGDVLAMYGHPDQQDSRHRNTLPEVYRQGANRWTNLPKDAGSSGTPNNGGRRFLFFPRGFLMADGKVFFATPMPADWAPGAEGTHFSTAFDVRTGDYVAPKIAAPTTGAYNGWDRPCVLLPLLPEEGYAMHIVHVGGTSPIRLDLDAASPAWVDTGQRHVDVRTRDRRFANAVLLPTGEVCVVGGVADAGNEDEDRGPIRAEDPVFQTEIYDPAIDWTAGTYVGTTGTWELKESAQFPRNYHSAALLLPNGKVWVAGGNFNAWSGNPDSEPTVAGVTRKRGTKVVELYEPDYVAVPNRLRVTMAPSYIRYGQEMTVILDRAATQVRHASLIRCGSVTHSTNNDQRFVGLVIEERNGNTITLVAPPSGNVAPPGNYMLWFVDMNGNPSATAPFVRLGPVSCTVVTDRSTFSSEEVEALGGGGQATFTDALYVHYDGFIHTELTGSPDFSLTWVHDGSTVDASDLTLVPAGRFQEVEPGHADATQRITFPFHVRFHNLDSFAGFADRRQIRVTFDLDGLTCNETIDLTHAPNPYMIDIDPAEDNPAWLSTDVRVFPILTGQGKFGVTQQDDRPIDFIRGCLAELNDPTNDGSAMFDGLSTSAKLDLWTKYPWPLNLNVYNYAIARVRYRATTTTASKVKCFFRMFNVAATGLHYNTSSGYRRTAVGDSTVPLLGVAGGEVSSIPFFASDRVETVTGQAGAASMATQQLDTTYEMLDVVPDAGGAEVTVYFGTWLDINQTKKRFPIEPGGSDGPWSSASCRSIQELVRGEHMCLVAEVFFQPDPIDPGETPGTSDNLSQRNLAILHSDNPGSADSRTVMHTFELKPSDTPALGANLLIAAPAFDAASVKRFGPDELLVRWHNLPRDSEVTITFSDIDTAEIEVLAALRQSSPAFEVVSSNKLRLTVAGATWIPIPGGRAANIPALLTIRLPEGVVDGQEFRVSLHQVAGRTRTILGSCEFRIPISTAAVIRDETARTLSVFKHILGTIPTTNRWHPIIQRYVHGLGAKLDGLGGDAGNVHGNPDGSGEPYRPPDGADGDPGGLGSLGSDCCKCLALGAGLVVAAKTLGAAARCLCRQKR